MRPLLTFVLVLPALGCSTSRTGTAWPSSIAAVDQLRFLAIEPNVAAKIAPPRVDDAFVGDPDRPVVALQSAVAQADGSLSGDANRHAARHDVTVGNEDLAVTLDRDPVALGLDVAVRDGDPLAIPARDGRAAADGTRNVVGDGFEGVGAGVDQVAVATRPGASPQGATAVADAAVAAAVVRSSSDL